MCSDTMSMLRPRVGSQARLYARCYTFSMDPFFETSFGGLRVRFALKDGDLFVSKDDLFAAVSECFTEGLRPHAAMFVDTGLSMLGDGEDRKVALLGGSVIGAVIHFHAAANLLDSLSGFTDVESDDLRESSFRVNTLRRWYVDTILQVDKHFGRTFMDTLHSVKDRLDRINPPLIVHVSHTEGFWTAECDELGLVTEAESYEELTDRVWAVAPELAHENLPGFDVDRLRLGFQHIQAANINAC